MASAILTVRPLTGAMGAELSGIDLSQPLDNKVLAAIRQAWLDHHVLFFRDQKLTPDQHVKFSSHFGKLTPKGFMPSLAGHPNVMVQEYPELYKREVNDVTWHCDATFLPMPTRGSVLYALEVPDGAGDTVWANMHAAYENLSSHMQIFLSGLTAIHDNVHRDPGRVITQMGAEHFSTMRKILPPIEHPVVRTHPETGRKCLFVNELMTSHIKDINRDESNALLAFLFAHQTKEEFQCRFRWEVNSVAFWDNRCTIHKGVFDFGDQKRLMHRVSIEDDQSPE